ncbi:aldo keto reductase family oxidoreductase, partial [Cystoisospora suis]
TSLKNLGVEYLDSLLLHSPLRSLEKTIEAWRCFEEAVDEGLVRFIGLSNCSDLPTLQCIYAAARHKPRFLQNRFYADTGYDAEIRDFCVENGVVYQAFWTLTANPHILRSSPVSRAASRLEASPAQIWYRYLLEKGMMVLTGTSSQAHMEEDVDVLTIDFSREDFDAIDNEVAKYTL